MISEALFSSDSDEWTTPQWLYDMLNQEFRFTLDPCATQENAKCEKFFTQEQDGLIQSWDDEVIFCNPPYSKIKDWIQKGFESKAVSVFLIPARTDTKYFHAFCSRAKEIRFIKGRLKFSNSKNSAPFPSCLVVFDGRTHETPKCSFLSFK
jgi:site-specific DNA-methyltransferase (adenine-specific)